MTTRTRIAAGVVLALVLAGAAIWRASAPHQRTLTATFSSTTSLYTGAQVKVLGVKVGSVTAIHPAGDTVQVTISYDSDVQLPLGVHADIVPPSIVGDRFVQLTPAYVSGPALADDAALPLARTAVPIELDQTYASLDDLARALGPRGANAHGALSRLVVATADSLRGNGAQLHSAITSIAALMNTLADGSTNIGATIDNLDRITSTFAGNDLDVRRLVTSIAAVSSELNTDGPAISGAIVTLDNALNDLHTFLARHRRALGSTTAKLVSVSSVLSARSAELDRLLALGPVGLTSNADADQPTNWDPQHPGASLPTGRTSSATLRGDLLDAMNVQIAHALSGVCAALPVAQQQQLQPLCALLLNAGGDLGTALNSAIRAGMGSGAGSPTTLGQLLGGGR